MKTRKNVSLKVALMMFVLLFSFTTSTAQTKKNNMVYDVVEVMPQFPGGQIAMLKYIMENIKYPKQIKICFTIQSLSLIRIYTRNFKIK